MATAAAVLVGDGEHAGDPSYARFVALFVSLQKESVCLFR